jgi:serine/threonine protein phosphatase 1
MAGFFRRLGTAFTKAPALATVALERRDTANMVVYAVGDVHGCLDLYKRLEQSIVEDARALGQPACIILLGDVIDRGPASADMVDHLLSAPPRGLERLCLRGNHEDMMLRFLAKPSGKASWLDYGGYETLMSYGMRPPGDEGFNISSRQLELMINTFIPQAHRDFFASLPYGVIFGDYALVHAALDRSAPSDAQPIVEKVVFTPRRIAIDTGAYVTGRLTAVRLMAGAAPVFLNAIDEA